MINKKQLQSLFASFDFIGSLFIAILMLFLVPQKLQLNILKDIFEVGIAVLSIIFSVYFAALAVVITSGDNKFIKFLEEDGSYTHIIWTFKVTLLLLFIALIISIILFVIVLPFQDKSIFIKWFPGWGMAAYSFIALWSLFAAALATLDAISYAEFRTRYIKIFNNDET